MAEVDFERRLERLFGDAPELPDASAFAARVERKLARGWTARRLLIGVAGVTGGVIGASQMIMSNFFERMETASQGSAEVFSSGVSQMAPRMNLLANLPDGGPTVWIAVAAAVVLMGFALTRVIEEI